MDDATRRDQIQQFTDLWSCPESDLAGHTFGDLLAQVDGEAIVYWRSWTDQDLAIVLVPKKG